MSGVVEKAWHRRANNFDFLRLALAVLVIYSHSYPLGGTSERYEPVMRLSHGQMTGGAVAVNLFFIMSGFLVAASAERSCSAFSFMRKRVVRIYPAFIVSAVLTAVVAMPIASATFQYSGMARLGNILLQTLRLREFAYSTAFAANPYPDSINGSVWSIQFEFWCYVGVAVLLVSGFLGKRAVLLTLFVISVLMSILFQWRGWIFGGKFLGDLLGSPQLWARLLPLYLAGVVFYQIRSRIRYSAWLVVASVLALIGASWLPFGYTAVFPFAGTYLIFYLAFSPWLRLQTFGRFGDFSYGMYLYAFPIQQILILQIGRPVQPWKLFLCATPVTLLTAMASWYGIERRCVRPGRRKEVLSAALEAESQPA